MKLVKIFFISLLALGVANCSMFEKTPRKGKAKSAKVVKKSVPRPAAEDMSQVDAQPTDTQQDDSQLADAQQSDPAPSMSSMRNMRGGGSSSRAATSSEASGYLAQVKQAIENSLESELRQQILELEQIDDATLKLTLGSEASFAVNSAILQKPAGNALHALGELLAKWAKTDITVTGYTDSSGDPKKNQALSKQRADRVAAFLIKHDVNTMRVSSEGKGADSPRADNSSPEGRQQIRRVEIVITQEQ